MVFRPVRESRLINSILVAGGTMARSFCKPSRGPTSTMRTKLSLVVESVMNILEVDQHGVGIDEFAFVGRYTLDGAGTRRLQGQFHFHRLHDDEVLAFLDAVADPGLDDDDAARHRRNDLV